MPAASSEFVSMVSIATLGGASAAVVVVVSALKKAFGVEWRWLPLLLSALVVFAFGIGSAEGAKLLQTILLSVVNTCVLYMTATGINQTGVALTGDEQQRVPTVDALVAGTDRAPVSKPFLSSWL